MEAFTEDTRGRPEGKETNHTGAMVTIAVTKNKKRKVLEIELEPELAREFIEKLKEAVTDLPAERRQIIDLLGMDGRRIVEITLNPRPKPPQLNPPFRQLFEEKGGDTP